jgi:outer membrane protein TolC
LIGGYPANSIAPRGLPTLTNSVAAGVPAELLNRRPDLIAARRRVAAAFHNEKAAELLKLPSITLRYDAGYDHLENTISRLIGGLFMPVWDNGEIDAYIAAATADQKLAIANYRNTVLRAWREVEDALAKERQLADRLAWLQTTEKEYKIAYDMTMETYHIGEGTIIDVLTAQGKWIDAKIARVSLQRDRLINRVNLYLALGGGINGQPAYREKRPSKQP